MHHIVILGAGFGGLNAARALRRDDVRVTLVDQHNYHAFQPLFYQVATAGLEPAEIAHNVRDVLHDAPNVHFRLGSVTGIDLGARRVTLSDGPPLGYDMLIVATGAVTSFYGVEGAEAHSFPLKSLGDAVRLRNHTLRAFETFDVLGEAAPPGTLTFVVVGGGPTGVETAGALAELIDTPMRRDFKTFDAAEKARVLLVERGEDVLDAYPPRLRQYARRALEKRGIEVRTNAAVAHVEAGGVVLDGGTRIDTCTLVWAAGVAPSPVVGMLGVPLSKSHRVVVAPDLSVPGHPEVFVIGDAASARDAEGRELPQLAPVAMQQARHVAKVLTARRHGRPGDAFRYNDRGTMATIGRNAAVADVYGRVKITGFVAWLAWAFLHLYMLIGFRNRANVFVNWIYSYFTYDRGARLLFDPSPARENPGGSTP